MGTLTKDWLNSGLIDFEYKKYQLLAYLQEVKHNFEQNKVYPDLGELIEHYRSIVRIQKERQIIDNKNEKELSGINWEELKLNFESKSPEQNELINELNLIIDFSISALTNSIHVGKSIYDLVEEQLKLAPVGVLPLRNAEGYLFIHTLSSKEIFVYRYYLSTIEDVNEHLRALQTSFIDAYPYTIKYTYENIKLDLIRKNKEIAVPAVYVISSHLTFPYNETLFPIAKRYFVSRIS